MATFTSVLSAISTALGAIKSATSIPGINLLPYVSTVNSAVDTIQFAMEKGKSVATFVADFTETFATGLPSEDKLAALDAKIADLRAKVHAPLPAKEEGEDE